MKALWLEDGELSVRDVEVPRPAAGEALVRVRLSGICGTDLELVRGYYPFTGVIGHEFVGDVVESPDDPSWVGARVVGEINAACGFCEQCAEGRPTHCEQRTVLGITGRDGAHAEFLTLPIENLHRVPDGVPDEAAVFTEPVAAAAEILTQVTIGPRDRVLLVGAGRLGQLIARVLVSSGAHVRVVARHEHQKALLHARGIETIEPADIEPRRYDVAVEATGSPSGFDIAASALRPRGTLVLKSTYRGDITLDLAPFVVDEITIIGSRCGPFAAALGLLEMGAVDPLPLIDARYPLSEAVEAMRAAGQPGTMKVLLQP
jgi:2-desacetyl-2-hydroxyethyl bacteriochlorophyllide A dehydrogenase